MSSESSPGGIDWGAPAIKQLVVDKPRSAVWNDEQFAAVMRLAGAAPGARLVDVGAGSGAMLDLFADLLHANPGATLTCVDREAALTAASAERAAALGIGERVTAITGDAAALELPTGAFDLAFCQTVLMHAAEPARCLAELRRILRPGGAMVVVEGNAVVRPGLLVRAPVDAAADIVRLWRGIQAGRIALGRGDIAIGERLPALFAEAGLALVDVRLVDRTIFGGPTAPPERGREQRDLLERAETVMAMWRPGFAEAFVAAGGSAAEFDRLWQVWRDADAVELAAARAGEWSGILCGVIFAAIGRVPDQS